MQLFDDPAVVEVLLPLIIHSLSISPWHYSPRAEPLLTDV